MEHEIDAWILVEETENKGVGVSSELFFREKDALKAKADWEAGWDVFKEIAPCKVTYSWPLKDNL